MTAPDHASLRALAEGATPGEWLYDYYAEGGWAGVRCAGDRVVDRMAVTPQDAEFIAAANPTAVLSLLDENAALRADIAAAEQRGREDNADHGMCYVSGSAALEAILEERDKLAATLARVEALADEWTALDMGVGLYPEDSAHRDAHEARAQACADDLRAALESQ